MRIDVILVSRIRLRNVLVELLRLVKLPEFQEN